MFHTGSRGFGYQICDDYIGILRKAIYKYGIILKDQQLACAPFNSEEGQRYFNAMKAAANYAWANRQIITDSIRKSFEKVFKKGAYHLDMKVIYDVSHNIARVEEIEIGGEKKILCVHRKGATRALPAGHYLLPDEYKEIGQPVLIPGDMGRHSFILIGAKQSKEAFYSAAHGAGRLLSRHEALKQGKGIDLIENLKSEGIIVKVKSKKLLAEEAPFAYKDADDITEVVEKAGLAIRVARLKPVAVVKG
jgi:tRNA-splicing ligase RtcB